MEQSLQVMAKQERLENWTARITACRGSGMTVREWCRENSLSEKTYYYWQRRLFDTLSQQRKAVQPTFAEITLSTRNRLDSGVAVTVRISGAEADIHAGADSLRRSWMLSCGANYTRVDLKLTSFPDIHTKRKFTEWRKKISFPAWFCAVMKQTPTVPAANSLPEPAAR